MSEHEELTRWDMIAASTKASANGCWVKASEAAATFAKLRKRIAELEAENAELREELKHMTETMPGRQADQQAMNHPIYADFKKAFDEVYRAHSAGGSLHIVTDDNNTEDEHVLYCADKKDLTDAERRCINRLMLVPLNVRDKFLEEAWKTVP